VISFSNTLQWVPASEDLSDKAEGIPPPFPISLQFAIFEL